jgi:hypothetical protein
MYRNPETGNYEKKFFFELKYDTFVGKPKSEVTDEFKKDCHVYFEKLEDEVGIVRWNKSNNVPPEDWLTDFRDLGLIDTDTLVKSLVAKDLDTKRHVDEWIESRERWMKEDPEGFKEAQREIRLEAMYS